ncbi:MAG TPA: superoxide dismutase [Cu-Zn] SodC [Pseudomonadales bacterium]|nr:superoxide dismutase [Cu-Zn] SodC [Pseudomonadales bacterium]HMZ70235.1 superoxide dismutase [Cu-Zn] SodC [Pseudomonadales bacterium]HNL23410.1 superoxide dismutase [Cu-Zn] SodC [Pseudomonadales bacterium]
MRIPALFATCLLASTAALAAETSTPLNLVTAQGIGAAVGSVRITETPYGLVFQPALQGLPPGLHGFHVHEHGTCMPAQKNGVAVAALAAGGHLDPKGSKKHGEPWGDGHLGDLPPLHVAADGSATHPVLAPRLKLADVNGRALMLHAGGDNHADQPAPLGGGGERMACGVIPQP